jgi:hypothetical protein
MKMVVMATARLTPATARATIASVSELSLVICAVA